MSDSTATQSHGQPDQQQTGNPGPIDTTRHDNAFGIEEDDIGLVAAFTKRVGNELYTVDHHNVGSNSNIKALQLDNKKIFSGVPSNSSNEPPQVGQSETPSPPVSKTSETERPSSNPFSEAISAPPPAPSAPAKKSELTDVEKRLSRIERNVKTIQKAKRIKRGVTYTVSSNSFKGEIRDAELLAEYVISEVAKGVKSITIKLNDSKNTE
jgi:hypothetical protein